MTETVLENRKVAYNEFDRLKTIRGRVVIRPDEFIIVYPPDGGDVWIAKNIVKSIKNSSGPDY